MATLNYNVTINDLGRAYNPTKLGAIVDEFIDSGKPIAEYVFAEGEYASAAVCAAVLKVSLKKRHINTVKIVQRKDKVFLVRKDMNNG